MFIYYDIIRGFIFRYDKHKDTSATAYPDNICRSPIVPEQHFPADRYAVSMRQRQYRVLKESVSRSDKVCIGLPNGTFQSLR